MKNDIIILNIFNWKYQNKQCSRRCSDDIRPITTARSNLHKSTYMRYWSVISKKISIIACVK